MFITPQAFGRQIALLEKEMGFLLFERSTRSIHLTENGKICYDKNDYRKQQDCKNNRHGLAAERGYGVAEDSADKSAGKRNIDR